MARHYDRLIRYYDSWFDDLLDQDKELTPGECWRVILAIRDAQQMSSTEPLRNLPLEIRRALSMSTLIEQVERIIERCDNMRQRGSLGGLTTKVSRAAATAQEQVTIQDIKAPDDGQERNLEGLILLLKEWGCSDDEVCSAAQWSNYGQIGHPVWKMISSARYKEHPRDTSSGVEEMTCENRQVHIMDPYSEDRPHC